MRGTFFWLAAPLAALFSLTACREEAPAEPRPAQPAATPAATPTPEPAYLGARSVAEETDTFLFEYAYPMEPGEIPMLAAWLDARLEMERAVLAQAADKGRAEARGNGFPFNKYSSLTEWRVVADLPDYLSLSATLSTYTGGAHPNYDFDAMIWDKAAGKVRAPMSFFTSAAALDEALGEELCAALNAERAKRRGMEVPQQSEDTFDQCVKGDEANLLLGSRSGTKFDRIGVQIAPYVAGPYAEGAYEFTFDITPQLLATVKPEYRRAFATRN